MVYSFTPFSQEHKSEKYGILIPGCIAGSKERRAGEKLDKPYIEYITGSIGAKSLLFKRAAEKNNAFLRAKTVEENREAKRKLAALLPIPPKITARPAVLAGVACEWIRRPESSEEHVLLYLHGGSWAFGDLRTVRAVGIQLAELSRFTVLAAEYRLSPEHPYPAGLTDCFSVYKKLLEQGFPPEKLVLFGDSAGGNLALALLHLLKEEGAPLPAAVACASPVTNLTPEGAILRERPDLAFTQYGGEERDIVSLYLDGQDPLRPTASPVFGDMAGFPPLLIHTGGDEVLLGDNIAFAEAARGWGVDVTCKVWQEMYHDFTIVGVALKESRQSMQEAVSFLEAHIPCIKGGVAE